MVKAIAFHLLLLGITKLFIKDPIVQIIIYLFILTKGVVLYKFALQIFNSLNNRTNKIEARKKPVHKNTKTTIPQEDNYIYYDRNIAKSSGFRKSTAIENSKGFMKPTVVKHKKDNTPGSINVSIKNNFPELYNKKVALKDTVNKLNSKDKVVQVFVEEQIGNEITVIDDTARAVLKIEGNYILAGKYILLNFDKKDNMCKIKNAIVIT